MTSSSSFSPTLRALCAEATKGPWAARENTFFAEFGPADSPFNIGDTCASLSFGGVEEPNNRALATANASLIVFLANRAEAIAELAEAAENMCAWQEAIELIAPELGGTLKSIYTLRAALAKLEGEG